MTGDNDDDNEVDTLENMANFVDGNSDGCNLLHHDGVHNVQKDPQVHLLDPLKNPQVVKGYRVRYLGPLYLKI